MIRKSPKDEPFKDDDWIKWRVIFLGWAIIGLFFVGRNIVQQVSRGQPIAWHRAILFEMIYWMLWGALMPLIFRVARRFPVEDKHKLKAIALLIPFGVFVAVLHISTEFAINISLARGVIHVPAEEINTELTSSRRYRQNLRELLGP